MRATSATSHTMIVASTQVVAPEMRKPSRLRTTLRYGCRRCQWPGSMQAVSRPSTWLSRPNASHEPMLMLSSTISRWS